MSKEVLSPWRRFVKLLEMERKDITQIFYYAVFSGLLALSLPLGIQAIINLIQGAQVTTSWIVLVVLVSIGVAFTGVLQLMQIRIIENIQQKIFTYSSFELAYRFPTILSEILDAFYPPELANRFFDTLSIQKGLSKVLIDVPSALLQIIFALLLLSFYNPSFIIFGILLLISVYFVFQYTGRKGLETSLIESKYKYKTAHWIQEVARSVISFKISGNTSLALEKNNETVDNYLKSRENHFKIIRLQYIKLIGFKVIITAGLLLIGGLLVLNQQMNIGQFVAAEIIILLVINSVEKLILGLETLYDMLTSLEKLGQVLDLPLESQEGEILDYEEGVNLELLDISYRAYQGDREILSNINLKINPQSRILLEGNSGSGKSTLIRLISNLIEPSSGSLTVNNLALSAVHPNHYRAQLGLVLSDEFPFEGTLRQNLTFGDTNISNQEIYTIIEALGLSEFLKSLPKGLETILYPEGKQLPYTTSKKIVLARALLILPKLLNLENPLDLFPENEAREIIDFIGSSQQKWAMIIVSQNSYWEKYCKEKITLQNGQIIT